MKPAQVVARSAGPQRRSAAALLVALGVLAGCAGPGIATSSYEFNPSQFAAWPCEQMHEEADRVQRDAVDLAYTFDSPAGANVSDLSPGLRVFWPALLAMRSSGPASTDLARLKGRFDALQIAARRRSCAAPLRDASTVAAAPWPVAPGDRLVYDDRPGARGPAREVVFSVTTMRRDGIEFEVDDRSGNGGHWFQDRAGNPRADASPGLAQWRRLLRRGLELGEVLDGDLVSPATPAAVANLRGQVVATGAQTIAGRRFEVAVVELFGEAPATGEAGQGSTGSARIEGVLAVDRTSGVLLRLELQCRNPDFSLRRRLLRIEPTNG